MADGQDTREEQTEGRAWSRPGSHDGENDEGDG